MKHTIATLLLAASVCMGQTNNKLGVLRAAMAYGDTKAKVDAIRNIAGLGPEAKGAVKLLAGALFDSDAKVRQAAAKALGHIGPEAPAAIKSLMEYAKGKDPDQRKTVIETLGKLGPPAAPATDMIVEALASKDSNLRKSAATALGLIGSRAAGAKPALQKAMKDPDSAVGFHAAWALVRIGAPDAQAIETLVGAMGSNPQAPAALISAGKPGIDALVKMLSDADPKRRILAVETLASLGGSTGSVRDALKQLKNDKDPKVRAAVKQALDEKKRAPIRGGNSLVAKCGRKLACSSRWHNINGSWRMERNVDISGSEVLLMIAGKSGAGQHALPKKLADSLSKRFFAAAQFNDAQKQELAKWLGSERRNEESSLESKMKAALRTVPVSGKSARTAITLTGRTTIKLKHRLGSRYGPNWNEAKWSLRTAGRLLVKTATGRIIDARIRFLGQCEGRYHTSGTNSAESYAETFTMLLTSKPTSEKK